MIAKDQSVLVLFCEFSIKNLEFYLFREGDISLVEADVITNTTDKTLTDKNTISNRILNRAGPHLYDEIINDNRRMLFV